MGREKEGGREGRAGVGKEEQKKEKGWENRWAREKGGEKGKGGEKEEGR